MKITLKVVDFFKFILRNAYPIVVHFLRLYTGDVDHLLDSIDIWLNVSCLAPALDISKMQSDLLGHIGGLPLKNLCKSDSLETQCSNSVFVIRQVDRPPHQLIKLGITLSG